MANKDAVHIQPITGPVRLDGDLAPAQVIGNNVTKKRRIDVLGADTIKLRFSFSSVSGTPTINFHPMLADATGDDGSGTRATTDVPTAVTIAGGEQEKDITIDGDRYFDIEVVSGALDAATVDFIDIYPKF